MVRRFSRPLLIALSLVACNGANLGAFDGAGLVGSAHAATPPPASVTPSDLWRDHTAADPLPAGVVPMQSLAPLVKALKPGVVNIYTTSVVRQRIVRRSPGGNDPFEEFFRRFGEGQGEESRRQSLGSGFLINPKGYAITNNHVVEGASEIKVRLVDGREFEAEVVGRDAKTDIALLKLRVPGGGEVKDLPFVFLGDSDKLEVGDFVLAAGNPFGLDHSVSLGIVSAKERVIGAGPYDDFIQTDAAINPGNSGGPLFNTRGEVVGVNTAIVGQGIGFAVPVNMLKVLLPQLLTKGRIVRGWLGVSIQDVTPELAKTLKIDRARGALVADVVRKSPAEVSGLKAGDVVVGLNGKSIDTYNQLSREIAFLPPGTVVQLALLRDGKARTLDVKIGLRPEDDDGGAEEPPAEASATSDKLGITVVPLNAQRAARLGIEFGVQVASVKPDGAAARAGARPGDVLVELQRRPIRTLQDYQETLATLKPGDLALLRLQRENASSYIAVKVPR